MITETIDPAPSFPDESEKPLIYNQGARAFYTWLIAFVLKLINVVTQLNQTATDVSTNAENASASSLKAETDMNTTLGYKNTAALSATASNDAKVLAIAAKDTTQLIRDDIVNSLFPKWVSKIYNQYVSVTSSIDFQTYRLKTTAYVSLASTVDPSNDLDNWKIIDTSVIINALTANTTIADGDYLVFFNTATQQNEKILKSDLIPPTPTPTWVIPFASGTEESRQKGQIVVSPNTTYTIDDTLDSNPVTLSYEDISTINTDGIIDLQFPVVSLANGSYSLSVIATESGKSSSAPLTVNLTVFNKPDSADDVAWIPSGSYTAGDRSSFGGLSYRAKLTHTGVATTPDLDTTNWEVVSNISLLDFSGVNMNTTNYSTMKNMSIVSNILGLDTTDLAITPIDSLSFTTAVNVAGLVGKKIRASAGNQDADCVVQSVTVSAGVYTVTLTTPLSATIIKARMYNNLTLTDLGATAVTSFETSQFKTLFSLTIDDYVAITDTLNNISNTRVTAVSSSLVAGTGLDVTTQSTVFYQEAGWVNAVSRSLDNNFVLDAGLDPYTQGQNSLYFDLGSSIFINQVNILAGGGGWFLKNFEVYGTNDTITDLATAQSATWALLTNKTDGVDFPTTLLSFPFIGGSYRHLKFKPLTWTNGCVLTEIEFINGDYTEYTATVAQQSNNISTVSKITNALDIPTTVTTVTTFTTTVGLCEIGQVVEFSTDYGATYATNIITADDTNGTYLIAGNGSAITNVRFKNAFAKTDEIVLGANYAKYTPSVNMLANNIFLSTVSGTSVTVDGTIPLYVGDKLELSNDGGATYVSHIIGVGELTGNTFTSTMLNVTDVRLKPNIPSCFTKFGVNDWVQNTFLSIKANGATALTITYVKVSDDLTVHTTGQNTIKIRYEGGDNIQATNSALEAV